LTVCLISCLPSSVAWPSCDPYDCPKSQLSSYKNNADKVLGLTEKDNREDGGLINRTLFIMWRVFLLR
jgi:hypothetical protein